MKGQSLARWASRIGYRSLVAMLLSVVWATAAVAAPSPPSLISPGSSSGPGQTITDLTPRMHWNHAPGATGYGLYVRDLTTGGTLVYDNDFVPYDDDLTLPSAQERQGGSARAGPPEEAALRSRRSMASVTYGFIIKNA